MGIHPIHGGTAAVLRSTRLPHHPYAPARRRCSAMGGPMLLPSMPLTNRKPLCSCQATA